MSEPLDIKPDDVKEWQARWSGDRLEKVNQQLTRFARRTSVSRQPFDLGSLKLDTCQGRADLRGITLSDALACFEVESVDFSGLQITRFGQLGPFSGFKDCKFDRAGAFPNVRHEFERCSFDSANLNRATMGRSFVGCSFRRTNLQRSIANESVFRDCIFDGANLRRIEWHSCQFYGCRFVMCKFGKGSLAGSSFSRCEIDDGTLQKAEVQLDRVCFDTRRPA